MRRTFLTLLAVILTFSASIPSAFAMVLKDVDAQPGVPRTGVLIVGVSAYIDSWETTEVGSLVITNDAYAKRLADAFAKKPGVHYVELLTGSEATSSGITASLQRVVDEHLAFLVFSYRGLGLGADTRESCFAAADWSHTKPLKSCLPASTVNELIVLAAPRQLVLLDASTPAPTVTAAIKADMFGPTADDWPSSGDTAVASSGKKERHAACNSFSAMLVAVLSSGAPEDALTFGTFTSQIDGIAKSTADKLPSGVQSCGETPLQPSIDATWFADVVIVPGIEVPKPVETVVNVTPLPTDPLTAPTKATKKIGTPTVASLITTGVCAAVGGTSWAYGEHRLNQYNDPTWAAENFPGGDADRFAAGEAEIPTYGYLAIGGFSCAGIGAAASGLTWYFGK